MNRQRIQPGPGQESVWDYPRPPRIEDFSKPIQVIFNGITIADTGAAKRVLETSHPPVYYIPPSDVVVQYLNVVSGGSTWCEWKGAATYYNIIVNGQRADRAAWTYDNPTASFTAIKGYFAFYPTPMDACFVDGEKIEPQAGTYYGGWVTSNIVGPFKRGAGEYY